MIHLITGLKKACSIFLLLVFSFNLVGVAIVFKIQQFQIRREIKHQIMQGVPDEKLCRISVSDVNASDLFWLEDDEFFYHGSMYDVVRTVALSETETVYYCVNDVLEESLFANLDALVKRHKSSQKPLSGFVKKLYQLLAGLYFKEKETLPFSVSAIVNSGWHYLTAYRSVFLSITSPPPQGFNLVS